MDFELPFVHDCTFWCYHFGKISLTLLVLSIFFSFRINSKHYLILNYLTLHNRKKLIVTHFTFEIKFTFSKLPFNCYIHDKSTWQNPLLDTKCWLIYFARIHMQWNYIFNVLFDKSSIRFLSIYLFILPLLNLTWICNFFW